MHELLSALKSFDDVGLIFTMPNADTNSRVIFEKVQAFCETSSNSVCFSSLGQQLYFSCMKYVDGVVGNSSSGLIEAPSFKIGTVNIGERQRGRQRAESVIDCSAEKFEIKSSINYIFSKEFREKIDMVANPYGNGGSSDRIVSILKSWNFEGILKKHFYDLPV